MEGATANPCPEEPAHTISQAAGLFSPRAAWRQPDGALLIARTVALTATVRALHRHPS
ncbi:MAG: hypothetical protein AB1426_03645 [Bacillota bacterium]